VALATRLLPVPAHLPGRRKAALNVGLRQITGPEAQGHQTEQQESK